MSLKKYFPFENLVYQSSLHKKELIEYFSQKIEEKKTFGINNTKNNYSKPYIGKIIGDKFEIERAIEYRNSFPVSYTHLDVYKRQKHSHGTVLSPIGLYLSS